MSDTYTEIREAENIKRDEDGYPYSFGLKRDGEVIPFATKEEYQSYVDKNYRSLKSRIAFSPGATSLTGANWYLATKLKEKGVL